MASTLATSPPARHLERLEVPLRPAKASLNKVEVWAVVGQAIGRTFALAGLTEKEGAALVDRHVAQVSRWLSGLERPQLEAVFAVEALRPLLVVALAEAAGVGVAVETSITIRRTACG